MKVKLLAVVFAMVCMTSAAAQTPPDTDAAPPPAIAPPAPPPAAAPPVLTVEAVMARLREMTARERVFAPRSGPVTHAEGAIDGGAVVLALPVAYRQTGRLARALVRARGLFGGERLMLAPGAPVFATRFTHVVQNGYGMVFSRTQLDAWCGLDPDKPAVKGVCMLSDGTVAETGAGSPMFPTTLLGARPTVADGGQRFAVAVEPAETADNPFPPMDLVILFTEWDEDDLDIQRGVRVGGEVVRLGNMSVPREADGSALVKAYGAEFRFRPGAARRSATVEVLKRVEAFDPGADEAQLRAIAERLVEALRARAAPKPPAPPNPL